MDNGLGWRVVSAAVVGTSHQRLGLPCQDVVETRLLPGGILAAALADGAGTADYADQGARTAVEAALNTLSEWLELGLPDEEAGWQCLLCSAFEAARLYVQHLAEEQGEPLRAYASTLTCAIATGDCLAVGQLGDGAVVGGNSDGELFLANPAQRGEYANETYFLTQEDALARVEIRVYDRPVDFLAVMSDGLLRLALKMPDYEPHAPFFQPLETFIRKAEDEQAAAGQLAAFLGSERVGARTDDDKSLALAVRMEA